MKIRIITLLIIVAVASGCSTPAKRKKETYDLGYEQGQLDSIKRHYWMLQGLQKSSGEEVATPAYYTVPAQRETPDGRILTEHTVTVPVIE